ncbi:MAG: 2Fe-2S iron-sulfur cluster binding domain-containing protein [Xanthomonadales bacterium]|nr:2Fe-2S iron-sulfur cluster binding domain-containing protein [Xanthomonadales bacterium]
MDALIRYGGASYRASEGETILQALLRQGAQPAYSCGRGSCQVCMLKLVSGQVAASKTPFEQTGAHDHILPCLCRAEGEVELAPADRDSLTVAAEIVEVRPLAADIAELFIAPMQTLDTAPGQHVYLQRDADSPARPYSVVSQPFEDFGFRIHVRALPGGALSSWLVHEARPGMQLRVRGPQGQMGYAPSMRQTPLLLLATGVGAGALAGIARAALADGHAAGIDFHHGGRHAADLYLHAELSALARTYPDFRYHPCLSQAPVVGVAQGRITLQALGEAADLRQVQVFLCGHPAMVEDARYLAIRHGADRGRIQADPYVLAHDTAPRDARKLALVEPDPALWAALEQGKRLTPILRDFYTRVFADPRLAPYFHGLTVEYVAGKQYAFLAQVFSGERSFFGLNPHNGHHWMVISDELFDHREALFEQVLREHGLADALIQRWIALHEWFRAEIVKAAPKGRFVDGQMLPAPQDSVERLDLDTVCDRCGSEIPAGSPSRYVQRLGELHCRQCAGLAAD